MEGVSISNNQAFSKVLQCFSLKDLLELRPLNRKFSEQTVSNTVNKWRLHSPCAEPASKPSQFDLSFRNLHELTIDGIEVSAEFNDMLDTYSQNLADKLTHLHIAFQAASSNAEENERTAKLLGRFNKLQSLKLETYLDTDVAGLFEKINENAEMPLFTTLREVTLFTDDDLKGGEQIIAFITNLRNLNNLKIKPRGDLDVLSAINKNVQTVHICTPEQSETLETVKRFLARNKQADLTLQFMNPSELNYGDF